MFGKVAIIGGGLAGSEAALFLADHNVDVVLFEMRPEQSTPVHQTSDFAELVCSNSLKSKNPDSAAGMLKEELNLLESRLYETALTCAVPAGGALAVDRHKFSKIITDKIINHENIEVRNTEVTDVESLLDDFDCVIIATGPLTSNDLAESIKRITKSEFLSFFDAAAPIVFAESLNMEVLFSQDRYENEGLGDYLNAPLSKDEYAAFIDALLTAKRVLAKDFEKKDLFQACQPIEEIARSGFDAPRFGPMKPVGLIDPNTNKRPWAALQLRREDINAQSYNLVGFQTNLTFPEQKRVFSMIPGLENAEFARFGVMHRNTYVDAPNVIDMFGRLKIINNENHIDRIDIPIYFAGQVSGTEGYCEAIRSGLNCAISCLHFLRDKEQTPLPIETAFGSLMHHAASFQSGKYQPMHVNFGIFEPFENRIRNKRERYHAYALRGYKSLVDYKNKVNDKLGIFSEGA